MKRIAKKEGTKEMVSLAKTSGHPLTL